MERVQAFGLSEVLKVHQEPLDLSARLGAPTLFKELVI